MSSSSFNPLGPTHHIANPELRLQSYAKRVGVFYATREGHTQQIAEHIAADLRNLGFDVDQFDVRRPVPFSLDHYSAAVLAASAHSGNHEPEMIRFAKEHRTELEGMTTAFLSVTLSEAGAERQDATPAEHARFVQDVDVMLTKFFNETKWSPTFVKPVAGALLYSHYNFLLRLVMRSIAKKSGGDTDTSRDYDYTDWVGLNQFVEELAARIRTAEYATAAPLK